MSHLSSEMYHFRSDFRLRSSKLEHNGTIQHPHWQVGVLHLLTHSLCKYKWMLLVNYKSTWFITLAFKHAYVFDYIKGQSSPSLVMQVLKNVLWVNKNCMVMLPHFSAPTTSFTMKHALRLHSKEEVPDAATAATKTTQKRRNTSFCTMRAFVHFDKSWLRKAEATHCHRLFYSITLIAALRLCSRQSRNLQHWALCRGKDCGLGVEI